MNSKEHNRIDSQKAFTWFNRLAKAIYGSERFPDRGPLARESKKIRHLLFGKKPHIYRIICAVDKRSRVVNVLHIRHGLQRPLFEGLAVRFKRSTSFMERPLII